MIPGGVLSTTAVPSAFTEQVNNENEPLIDYEMGGLGLSDPSGGLLAQLWTAEYKEGAVYISAPNTPETVLFTRTGITEVALAFDQNMRPAIAFVDGTGSFLWWFDTTAGSYVFFPVPSATNPRICMDEKNPWFGADSDIVLAYMNGTSLCARYQRDRFLIEDTLGEDLNLRLISVCRNKGFRLQFKMREL